MMEATRVEYRIVPAADPEMYKKIQRIGDESILAYAIEKFDPDHPEYPHIRISTITAREMEVLETLKQQAAGLEEGLDE